MKNIPLVKDTISNSDIADLIQWLKTNPRLTKAQKTIEFEHAWSKWLGVKYSVFVNSGSSANLAMFYGLIVANKLKNKKVIVPCVSWVTTVSPVIQLGLEPILCDASSVDLGLDVDHFEKLCEQHKPAVVILVHVLGFPNNIKKITEICKKYDVILLEDSCESVGSISENQKTGTFGLASSFSTYYGHHFSTIEGGLISTDDYEMYNVFKSIRSHGWSRDLDEIARKNLQVQYGIDDFKNQYTFYHPGFNLRSTDLQAFIGINQLKKINDTCLKRYNNLLQYDSLIKNDYWKIKFEGFISNFAYPIIHPNITKIVSELFQNSIECRPLVCGSISKQPFYYERYGKQNFKFADEVHDNGMYVPNNPDMNEEDIDLICKIINKHTR